MTLSKQKTIFDFNHSEFLIFDFNHSEFHVYLNLEKNHHKSVNSMWSAKLTLNWFGSITEKIKNALLKDFTHFVFVLWCSALLFAK